MQLYLTRALTVGFLLMSALANASPRPILDARVAEGSPLLNRATDSLQRMRVARSNVREIVQFDQRKRSPSSVYPREPNSDFDSDSADGNRFLKRSSRISARGTPSEDSADWGREFL
ncbi:hypothetical protein SCHPADRAFT_702536 [Schizopora paradoxa]|uniref:Uncharacterized protein n=1 Tax=Schizopora paradoxa TaxID=27342 RepID=A0A0H2R3V9_9AGAM|nr:hypothetical protein SCHPADRAFT_702536 [Schizopora paradoxa]